MGTAKSIVVATVIVAIIAALIGVVYVVTKPTPPDQWIPDPLSFTVVDSVPIVRACVDLEVDEQELYLYSSDDDTTGTVQWTATGVASLPAGTEFALGEPLDGFTERGTVPADLPSLQFGYSIHVVNGGHMFSLFTHQELKEGAWYDGLGDRLSAPCTHEPCDPEANCINDWPQPTGRETNREPTFVPTPSATPAP
jgi:hypothetical protein